MTIRNRGLRTDRHQDSKEDRARWEPVLTDKALAEAMAAKAEIHRETSHLIWRSEHYNAQGQACIDDNEDPAPAKTLRFMKKASTNAIPHRRFRSRMTETSEAATMMHARGVKRHKKSPRGKVKAKRNR